MPFPLWWSDEEVEKKSFMSPSISHTRTSQEKTKLGGDIAVTFSMLQNELVDGCGFTQALESAASRIFVCFSRLGDLPEQDKDLIREMVRLTFGLKVDGTVRYLEDITNRMLLELHCCTHKWLSSFISF